jgi:hypothetical protein
VLAGLLHSLQPNPTMTRLGLLAAVLLALHGAAAQGQDEFIECLGGSPPSQSVSASSYVMDFSWSQNVTGGAGGAGIASFTIVDPEHNAVIPCRVTDPLLAFNTPAGTSQAQFKCADPNPALPGGEHASFSLGLASPSAKAEEPTRTLNTYLTWKCKDRSGAA